MVGGDLVVVPPGSVHHPTRQWVAAPAPWPLESTSWSTMDVRNQYQLTSDMFMDERELNLRSKHQVSDEDVRRF